MPKLTGYTGSSPRGSTDPLTAFLIVFVCGHETRIPRVHPNQSYVVGKEQHCYECEADRAIQSVEIVTATEDSGPS